MKKCLILFVFLSCFFGDRVWARFYSPNDLIISEIKESVRTYKANPTTENQFELAMAYGYNGFIEKGWKLLKKVPKSYAPEVVARYKALSDADPNEPIYPFKLGFGYYFMGDKVAAKASFRRVLGRDPQQVWAMGFIAFIEGDEQHPEIGVIWCKRALEVDKDAMAIHFLLAEGYRRTGNYLGFVTEMLTVGRLKTKEKASGINFEDKM
ncbi:MAG: hypothetical protein EXS67_00665 [Candidatus Margulisbacteria bacterium]|nr:hypothetical protein [Candidatus Margulisiibacteriota bacterium]